MKTVTDKQLDYIDFLIDKHQQEGTLDDMITEINPDFRENEDLREWIKFQSSRRASEVIDILKTGLLL